jgi:hypothetical protein
MSDSVEKTCRACQGSGKCARCGGTGSTLQETPTPIAVISGEVRGKSQTSRTCNRCLGSGICQACKGSGKTS